MGDISDALQRAREEEEASRGEAGTARPTPRRHAPLYGSSRAPAHAPTPSSPPRQSTNPANPGTETARSAAAAEIASGGFEPDPALTVDTSGAAAALRVFEEEERVLESLESVEVRPGKQYHAIPQDESEGWASRACAVDPQGPAAVHFRHFAVRMRAMLDQLPRQSMLVTSAMAREGKTTVSTNLALALASVAPESRIALVDMDLRRGRVAEVLEFSPKPGRNIEDVLSGAITLDDACVETDMPGLDFYVTSRSASNAHSLLGRSAESLFRALHSRYDYVICDGPPVLPVPDSALLSSHVGGCLAVASSGSTRHAAFAAMTSIIPRNAWMGVFLNRSRPGNTELSRGYYDAEFVLDESEELDAEIEAAVDEVTVK